MVREHPGCESLDLESKVMIHFAEGFSGSRKASREREKRHLQVNVTNPVQCSLHGKKCTVSVETRLNQPQPDFTKNRSGFILSVPGN
ncbi:hypothetical protein E5288_WYG020853 [Bos mutus]|uniref:Uncharacterized protein n=1 Tax=Bos mutus TaxID=72004 RepID=A0A6B0R3V7_9CETA|nr:hypothetical protein [Bos mutus]